MKIRFDFCPLRYLAQKFPVLSNPTADRHSDIDRGDAIYRWPKDMPGWEEVSKKDVKQLACLRKLHPPEVESHDLDKNATVESAIKRLDDWFLQDVEPLLPEQVVELLSRWLQEQWAPFSFPSDTLPEDYLSCKTLAGCRGQPPCF